MRKPTIFSRKTVTLPAEVWELVDDYRFAKRFRTETEAIRRLIVRGLEAEGMTVTPPGND
jgi:dsDNA-specific endonuclease/ATPase MutS2